MPSRKQNCCSTNVTVDWEQNNNVSRRNKILSHDLFVTVYHDQVSEKSILIYGDQELCFRYHRRK
jgi:hypothetical protein